MLQIQTIPVGPLGTNAYVLKDAATGQCAVIDPGAMQPDLLAAVTDNGPLTAILLTHGHYDHIGAVAQIQKETGAKIYLYEAEREFPNNSSLNLDRALMGKLEPFTPDALLQDGDEIVLGETTIHVLHTPGHTAGGCCYLADEHLFTGDTLFHGSMGRTDFPTSDSAAMMRSLSRLANLEGDYLVYPGHGPASTLEWERQNNPYLRHELGGTGKTDDFVY